MKSLSALLNSSQELKQIISYPLDAAVDIAVSGVTQDSRRVAPGFIFVATTSASGDKVQIATFIDDAIARGAIAIVVDQGIDITRPGVTIIRATNAKVALCHLAEAFYDNPGKKLSLIGVTGTNGKTSTTFMLHSILKSAGLRPRIMGTLGVGEPQNLHPSSHTTMEPEFISAHLRQFVDEGATHVIMEVSSHALVLNRIEALTFAATCLTNISIDHLDFHGSMEAYIDAKKTLFRKFSGHHTKIVLPANHPFSQDHDFLDRAVFFGSQADVSCGEVREHDGLTSFDCRIGAETITLTLPFSGHFHVLNACLSAAVAHALGIATCHIALGLKNTSPIPGRLETVPNTKGLKIVVDFAHTPDALDNVLEGLRPSCTGRLILVFGCGGDRDPSKRPLMGKVAHDKSDVIILTDDNPRSEDPKVIRNQVLLGIKDKHKVIEVPARREAIAKAIAMATSSDIVILAGKGHERFQMYGQEKLPFCDREEALKVLEYECNENT